MPGSAEALTESPLVPGQLHASGGAASFQYVHVALHLPVVLLPDSPRELPASYRVATLSTEYLHMGATLQERGNSDGPLILAAL